MKLLLATSLLFVVSLLPCHAVTMYTVALSGDQEVPAVSTTAMGTGTLELNDAQDRLIILLNFTGIDLDGAQTPDPNDDMIGLHIHHAAPGANGPIVFHVPDSDTSNDTLISAEFGTVATAWDETEGQGTTLTEQLANLNAGNLYFNLHTTGNPSGEIRGQIVPIPEPSAVVLSFLGSCVLLLRRKRR